MLDKVVVAASTNTSQQLSVTIADLNECGLATKTVYRQDEKWKGLKSLLHRKPRANRLTTDMHELHVQLHVALKWSEI